MRIPCLHGDDVWVWVLEVEVVVPRAAGWEALDSAVVAAEALGRSVKELSACLERSCDFQGPWVAR